MWFKSRGHRDPEAVAAKERAERALEESRKDRLDVSKVSDVLDAHFQFNHISQRIDAMLRKGQ